MNRFKIKGTQEKTNKECGIDYTAECVTTQYGTH